MALAGREKLVRCGLRSVVNRGPVLRSAPRGPWPPPQTQSSCAPREFSNNYCSGEKTGRVLGISDWCSQCSVLGIWNFWSLDLEGFKVWRLVGLRAFGLESLRAWVFECLMDVGLFALGLDGLRGWELEGFKAWGSCGLMGLRACGLKDLRACGLKGLWTWGFKGFRAWGLILWINTWNIGTPATRPSNALPSNKCCAPAAAVLH